MNESTEYLPATTNGDLVPTTGLPLPEGDQQALERAVKALEHTNLATRAANTVGKQLGNLGKLLPPGVGTLINRSAEAAIKSAMSVALRSLGTRPARDSRRFHKAIATLSGAAGGAFGLASLPVELPLSTVIILRSIADIARNEGEDLSDPDVALSCLEVFALGAHDKDDAYTDSGYYAVRGLLARTVSEASKYVIANGVADEAAPILVRFVAQIASRFGIVVSEKLAAQAVPIIGAAGGAAVNYAFVEHFQSIAYGHFTVRRLERSYGNERVRSEYERLLAAERVNAFV